MPRETVHYTSALTTCEAACGQWEHGMRLSMIAALVSCAACLRRMHRPDIPESALLRAVREAAQGAGYLTYHTLRSDGSEKGWPDVALCKPHRPLYLLELKTVRGKLTMDQQRWQAALAQCTGVVAQVVRPADLPHILALLKEDTRDA